MPFYKYRARNRDKYIVTDIFEAVDKGDAVRKLKKNDLVPIDVSEIKVNSLFRGKEITITSGVTRQDIVFFLSQFYNLLHAGLSVLESLKIIIDQTKNKYLRRYLIQILQDLRNGSTLYVAMGKHHKIFPKLLLEMIRVGEVIGNLESVIIDLHAYYDKQNKTTSEIKTAMMYPIFLLVATLVVTAFLMISVVPQFKETFKSAGKALPAVTQLVLNTSVFLQTKFIWVFLIIGLLVTGLIAFGKTKDGKMFYSKFALRVPIFGQINRKGNLIKVARTYSTLLKNSVNAIEAIEITRNILNNQIYIEIIEQALANVKNGIPLSKAFEKKWAVDPVFSSMMTIGEETATLSEMLSSISEYYDNEMDMSISKLKAMMEPMMIIILAFVVGTIVLAIMMPMFSMMESVG